MSNFTMSVGVRFKKPLQDISDVTLGSFTVKTNTGEQFTFDFFDVYSDVIDNELQVCLENLDKDSFPDVERLNLEVISSIKEIVEFCVQTEAEGVYPIGLSYLYFEFPEEGDRTISLSDEILNNTTFYVS